MQSRLSSLMRVKFASRDLLFLDCAKMSEGEIDLKN